jgi:outer membrane immunogenic protein
VTFGLANNPPFVPVPQNIGRSSGVVGGIQAGYNFQINPMWVIGVEADFNGADVRGGATLPQVGGNPTAQSVLVTTQRLDWFGTVRGRLGITPIDKLLIYGTGGLAVGEQKATVSATGTMITNIVADASAVFCLGGPCIAGSGSRTSTGWAAGGGFEYALWSNMSIKAEYLYMELGRVRAQVSAVAPSSFNNPALSADFGTGKYQIARVGLNWRFGSPVVAKY